MPDRLYEVWSTYKVTGVAHILASSAAEAARIGTEGYEDGCAPKFEFGEPHHETKMRAAPAASHAFEFGYRPDPPNGSRHTESHRPTDLCPACDFDPAAPHNGKGECRDRKPTDLESGA